MKKFLLKKCFLGSLALVSSGVVVFGAAEPWGQTAYHASSSVDSLTLTIFDKIAQWFDESFENGFGADFRTQSVIDQKIEEEVALFLPEPLKGNVISKLQKMTQLVRMNLKIQPPFGNWSYHVLAHHCTGQHVKEAVIKRFNLNPAVQNVAVIFAGGRLSDDAYQNAIELNRSNPAVFVTIRPQTPSKALGSHATDQDALAAVKNTDRAYHEGDIVVFRFPTGELGYARIANQAGLHESMRARALFAEIGPNTIREVELVDIIGKINR